MNKKIDTEIKNIKYYSDAIKTSENNDFIEFLKWFNGGDNLNAVINSGYSDFFVSILKPVVYRKTKNHSKQMIALEIGCGGGRILNAACKYFDKTIGTDIHNSFEALEQFLKQENTNFELYRIKQNKIPVETNSIDFIYSFIVFQHILKISIFKDYLAEIKRIMKSNGTTVIYFGRPRFLSKKIFKQKLLNGITLIFDRIVYEGIYLNIFKKGFYENHHAKVNHVNLVVSLRKARQMFNSTGLKIIDKGRSKKIGSFGTQYYFIAEHK